MASVDRPSRERIDHSGVNWRFQLRQHIFHPALDQIDVVKGRQIALGVCDRRRVAFHRCDQTRTGRQECAEEAGTPAYRSSTWSPAAAASQLAHQRGQLWQHGVVRAEAAAGGDTESYAPSTIAQQM